MHTHGDKIGIMILYPLISCLICNTMVIHIGEFEFLRLDSNLQPQTDSTAKSMWENHHWSSLMQLWITDLVYNQLIDEGR